MSGYRPNFKQGDHLANCDRCGFTFKASQLRKEWTGLFVCKDDWEPRHPQDFVRGVKDDPTPPWTRPQSSSDTSINDIEGNPITNINTVTVRGDISVTLTKGVDLNIQEWNTTLTANRTITLSTTDAIAGDTFTIYRTAGGAFTLDVGGLYTIPASVQEIVNVEYSGAEWILKDTTSIGL